MKETGVDVVVANLGTEHRASGQDLHYYYDAARAIKAKIGPRICLHGTSSVSNDQIGKLFEDGICKVNIWTALERDASPALTEWIVKNAAKVGGPKMEQKLIDEGYLTESSKTGDKSSLQYFTTAARQEIIFEEMKKITRGYLDLWYF
jgi:fructose-bisphosphate aldolase class II